MSTKNSDKELRETIGGRLKEFRQAVLTENDMTFEEYCKDINMSMEVLKAYESGERFPDYADLITICQETGLNLNWLIYDNGSMYFCREKEMEDIIRHIEENERGRYDHYKILLNNMRFPEMEDFIFHIHNSIIDLLTKLEQQIKKDKKNISILTKMTEDVMYEPMKYLLEKKEEV